MVDEGKDPQEEATLMLENAGIIQRKQLRAVVGYNFPSRDTDVCIPVF